MNDLRSRLAAADPGLTAAPDPVLLAAATATHRPSRKRVWVPAAAAAVALTVIIAPSLPIGGAPSASAEAVDVLDDAIASMAPTDPTPGPGDYWYMHSVGTYWTETGSVEPGKEGGQPPAGTYLVRYDHQQWIPSSGDGLTYISRHDQYLQREDGSALPEGAYPRSPTYVDAVPNAPYGGSWQSPTPQWLADLPRDPAALRDRLYADAGGHGHNDDASAFTYTVDALITGQVPSDVRLALYQVLRTVPGVAVTSRKADVQGASGVAIGRSEPGDGSFKEIVIDPSDGELVGITDGVPGLPRTSTSVQRELVHGIPDDVLRSATICNADGSCMQ